MTVEVVRTLPEAAWSRFVADHPAGSIFHTPEMFRVFDKTLNHRPELWAATRQGRVLALMLPVEVCLMPRWPLSWLTTRSVVYGSVLAVPGAEGDAALAELLRTYRQQGVGASLFTELRNVSCLEETQPILVRAGFSYEEHLNYIIDLDKPVDELFRGLPKHTRRDIRVSIARGVVVEPVTEPQQLDDLYALLRLTFGRAGVPLADVSLFEAVLSILVPRGMAWMFLARVDGAPVAASVELPYKDTIYSWYAGYDRRFRQYRANDRLVWHALECGVKGGYKNYDFGGAGVPGKEYGPRDFKAKYRGNLVNYGRNTCVHSHMRLGISRLGYGLWQRVCRLRLRSEQTADSTTPIAAADA